MSSGHALVLFYGVCCCTPPDSETFDMFAHLPAYAGDPILSLQSQYSKDTRPGIVNLSIGLYYDAQGNVPRLECVSRAQAKIFEDKFPSTYLPMGGNAEYCRHTQQLVFGDEPSWTGRDSIVTVQTIGGSGALKVGADFLSTLCPGVTVYLPTPGWDNHRAIFEGAGLRVGNYPYFDPFMRRLDFAGLVASLRGLPSGSVVLLHACGHNPTGDDLSAAQWDAVIDILQSCGHIPFIDMAYQGLSEGLQQDNYAVRALAGRGITYLVAHSFSKNFSLYGERCGSLSIFNAGEQHSERVRGHLESIIRRNYSSPPSHGASIVTQILSDAALRQLWIDELGAMRLRIRAMRTALHDALTRRAPARDWSYLLLQNGLFSYDPSLGSRAALLRDAYGIYVLESGRICLAGLNDANVEYVAEVFAAV